MTVVLSREGPLPASAAEAVRQAWSPTVTSAGDPRHCHQKVAHENNVKLSKQHSRETEAEHKMLTYITSNENK